jgi:hypothetical protein
VVLAIVAAVAVTVGVGAASALPVAGATLTTVTTTHPCAGTAGLAGGGSTLTVTLPSSGCAGRTVNVTLTSASGAVVGSGSATVSGNAATVTLPTTGAVAAAATVDGWHLGTTLSLTPTGPITPGNPSTTLSDITWTLITNNPTQTCVAVDVTTNSPTPVAWAADVDLAQPPFNGAAPGGLSIQGVDSWRYQLAGNVPSAGKARLTGTAAGGRANVVAGTTYRVTLCHWNLPPGVDTPSAYAVTTTQGTWTPTKACLDTTITGNGTSTFYVGWTTTVDMGPARAHLASTGHSRDAWTYGPGEWAVNRTSTGPSTFAVSSTGPSTVAGTQSFTFTTCAVDW